MEGITALHSHARVKDLRRTGRDISSTSEYDLDGGYSVWRHELEGKRVMTGFTISDVVYHPASERERAHTGKSWIAFRSLCEEYSGDVHKSLPLLVRMTRQAEAGRMTTVGGREAAVHRFAFDGLAGVGDPHAREIAAWLRHHRVSGLTLVVTAGADDGELLGLRVENRTMTTCGTPRMYCRSRTDLHSFGQPVAPKPAAPPEDEIYWRPIDPPKHG
jgi:hypothetical protein